MISYLALLDVCKQINDSARSKKQQRNVSVIQDIDGNNIGDDLPSEYSGSKLQRLKRMQHREFLK